MRFDLTALKYLNKDDFRVLTAIEMGMRNHEIVPVDLIQSISKIRNTSVRRILANLLKHKLIKHTKIQYEGYSLNFLGYDFLAIHSLIKQGILVQIGTKIGVGKESDVYLCYVKKVNSEISDELYNQIKENILTENALKEQNRQKKLEENNDIKKEEEENEEKKDEPEEEEEEESEEELSYIQNDLPKTIQTVVGELTIACIKFARLGRTSFRAVKSKRDYVKSQTHYNWLYLSRLSAQNEYKNMKGLYSHGFSVPRPYGYNRHAIIMEYVPSYPLNKVEEIKDKNIVYHKMMDFIYKLGSNGLIHGDFNEFNILLNIEKPDEIVVIDFPQMISINHSEAENYFKRDVQCVKNYFLKKFNLTFEEDLKFSDIKQINFLDEELKAYGYKKEKEKDKKINKEENEEKNEINEEKEINEEEDIDLGQQLDYEKEMIENMKKIKIEENEEKKEEKKNKKMTKEDIKNKVKKMMNKQNKIHVKESKMGNRFKGKKDISNKMAIKNA